MPEVVAYIGMGSNLENPAAQLHCAARSVAALPRTRLQSCSSLYRSDPMGPKDQPDYLNAVACVETGLEVEPLLDGLQAIEQAQGRVRNEHWGPRTLDLDILLYGEQQIDTERLQIPHPGIADRNFVLYPLLEIAPGLEIPGRGKLAVMAASCSDSGIRRLPGGSGWAL